MTIVERLQSLALTGWRFWIEDGRLRFRAPEGAADDATLAGLRAERDAIVAALQKSPELCHIAPLSDGQRALWFLWRLAPEGVAYNQSLPLRITAADSRDPETWRRACEALVARHPMLRTIFLERDGTPMQQVLPAGAIDWDVIDIAGAGEVSTSTLDARIAEAHTPPFDLAARPAVRFRLFDLGTAAPILLITFHHIVCDGWTLEIIRRELPVLAAGQDLPPVGATYQDFVWWQRHLLQSPEGERLRRYWHTQLAAPRPSLDLPVDWPRPAVQTYGGHTIDRDVAADLDAAIRQLATAEGVTTNVVFLAAYAAVLARWSRATEVVIGTPTAGRTRPEFAGVAGYFVEPVALRLAVEPDDTWRTLLARTRRVSIDALAHSDLPFARIVEELRVERDASRSPVFDVSFNFNSRRLATRHDDRGDRNRDVETFDISQAAGKFELTLSVLEDNDGSRLSLGYRTDLFEPETAEAVIDWLIAMLRGIVAAPTSSVNTLPLGPATSSPAVSGRITDVSALAPVHRTILAHADTMPGAIAVIADGTSLTYQELGGEVKALARALSPMTEQPNATIALLTGRTAGFVTGMLGVMAAGAAFVPIDPNDPPAFIEKRLKTAGVRAIVADAQHEALASGFGLPVVPSRPTAQDSSVTTISSRATSLDDVAYVIFTSGSTGEPKGVAVSHRALANYVTSIIDDLELQPSAAFGFISATTADLGHTAIFPSLVTGGTLHVLPERVATNPSAFAGYLEATPLDYLKVVPSHYAALAGLPDRRWAVPRLGLIFGGESTPWPLAERVMATGCRVFNHYGPTETTVGVLTHPAAFTPGGATSTLPLSRAVANTAIHLLDSERRSVPSGWPGEIYISGTALAAGYVGDPARTAERFVTLASGARAYRTGDIARQRADGSLVLLGRDDRQIKLHGHRIEIGQIEAALAQIPGVQQSVVLADADGAAASLLAAWVVPTPGAEVAPTETSIRAHLATELPRHMLPSRVMIVDEIPRTTNGKLDVAALRSMLAAIGPESRDAAAASHRPVDVIEWRLVQLWRDVLTAPDLGVDDDFFARGGHSLLAVRLAGQIAEVFGVELPLAAFFTHRTVRDMTRALRSGDATLPVLVQMARGSAGSPLVCFPGAGGDILYFNDLVASLSSLDGVGDIWGARGLTDPVPDTVEAAATRYVELIRDAHLADHGAITLAGHSFGALIAFEIARQLRDSDIAINRVIILDQPAPRSTETADVLARDASGWLRHVALRIGKLYGLTIDLSANDEDRLIRELRSAGVIAADVRTDQFRKYIALYATNARAAARYAPPDEPIDAPMLVCNAAERDRDLGIEHGDAATDGWRARTAGRVDVVIVPGTHITMLRSPQVDTLARCLASALKEQS